MITISGNTICLREEAELVGSMVVGQSCQKLLE